MKVLWLGWEQPVTTEIYEAWCDLTGLRCDQDVSFYSGDVYALLGELYDTVVSSKFNRYCGPSLHIPYSTATGFAQDQGYTDVITVPELLNLNPFYKQSKLP
jgi:hypothetical protein